jgi:hypothetical protein
VVCGSKSAARGRLLAVSVVLACGVAACLVEIGDPARGGAGSGGSAGTLAGGSAGGGWPDGAAGVGGASGAAGSAGSAASGGAGGDAGAAALPAYAAYGWRRPIVIQTSTAALPKGYSLAITLDHAALSALGRARADGRDVRIARWDGNAWQQRDRALDAGSAWGVSATTLWFSTSAAIAAGSIESSYYLFFGDPAPGVPPENLDQIFLFWDDFEADTLSKWSPEPSFSLASEQAHGGSQSVKAAPTSNTNHRLIANGVSGSDVALESWWYLSTNYGMDLAQGMRAVNPTAWDAWELSIDDDGSLALSKYVAGSFVAIFTQPLPPPAGVWARVTTRAVGDRMQAFVNGAQVAPASGWTDMLGGATAGAIWLRSFAIPSQHAWFIDDVRLRHLVDPEPSVSLGAEQPQ